MSCTFCSKNSLQMYMISSVQTCLRSLDEALSISATKNSQTRQSQMPCVHLGMVSQESALSQLGFLAIVSILRPNATLSYIRDSPQAVFKKTQSWLHHTPISPSEMDYKKLGIPSLLKLKDREPPNSATLDSSTIILALRTYFHKSNGYSWVQIWPPNKPASSWLT